MNHITGIEWHNIPGYQNLYEVSSDGQVRRIRGMGDTKLLSPWLNRGGYNCVALSRDGHKKIFLVHRLVMLAFVGESDLQVNHKNGAKTDNRVDNLEYCTPLQNIRHSIDVLELQYGIMLASNRSNNQGANHGLAKLNDDKVREIRKLYAERVKQRRLCRLFGVSPSVICDIVHRKTWKHID